MSAAIKSDDRRTRKADKAACFKPQPAIYIPYIIIIISLLTYHYIYTPQYKVVSPWKIPIKILNVTGNCSFLLRGADLIKLTELATAIGNMPEGKIHLRYSIDFLKSGSDLRFLITEKPLEALLYNQERNSFTGNYLQTGWQVEIDNPGLMEFVIVGQKQVNMNPTESSPEQPYIEPQNINNDDLYKVKILAKEISAKLVFDPAPRSHPQKECPIKLLQNCAPSNSQIRYEILDRIDIKFDCKISVIFYDEGEILDVNTLHCRRSDDGAMSGTVSLPNPKRREFLRPFPIRSLVLIGDSQGMSLVKMYKITVTDKLWGVLWGVIVVLGIYIVAFAMITASPFVPERFPKRCIKWNESLTNDQKLLRVPLLFAVDEKGHMCLSLAQILWWSLIVVFSLTFILVTRKQFLLINDQMLILLGISGGTSILVKGREFLTTPSVKNEYFENIKFNRIPRFRDLISINETVDLYKLQILIFTVLAGIYVLWQLFLGGAFPELQVNLLVLMGISSCTYVLGDSLALKRENKIEELQTRIDEIVSELERVHLLEYDSERLGDMDEITRLVTERSPKYVLDVIEMRLKSLLSLFTAKKPDKPMYALEGEEDKEWFNHFKKEVNKLSNQIMEIESKIDDDAKLILSNIWKLMIRTPEIVEKAMQSEKIDKKHLIELIRIAIDYDNQEKALGEMRDLQHDLIKARKVQKLKSNIMYYLIREYTDPSDWDKEDKLLLGKEKRK